MNMVILYFEDNEYPYHIEFLNETIQTSRLSILLELNDQNYKIIGLVNDIKSGEKIIENFKHKLEFKRGCKLKIVQ